jgi:tRNA pseudouridine55 synthase
MKSETEISRHLEIPSRQDISENGYIFLVKKPVGWSSFDVVKKIRIHFGVKKVGHAGTLDPLASGLLIVATAKKTKEISTYSGLDKEYEGIMQLGERTLSFDAETEVVERKDYTTVQRDDVEKIFQTFIGLQMQQPPAYSAVKFRGKPLYKYARKGRTIIIQDREINISEFSLLEFNPPEVKFRVACSKGTYVRSLVNEVGQKLACGAYLKSLIRTRIGRFSLNDAFTIDELTIQ